MYTSEMVLRAVKAVADPKRAEVNRWFFKTGKGQYGEGDTFIGLTVPACRTIAKQYADIGFRDIQALLRSPLHEVRLIALLIWVYQFEHGDEVLGKRIFQAYLRSTKWINNWDLVDLSADKIVGVYLLDKQHEQGILTEFANSDYLWKRRIAIVATYAHIKRGQFDMTEIIAQILLYDSHDLIQKAVGWMLREMGKRDQVRLVAFLQPRYNTMPRTMLRYAIEKFPEEVRKAYLKGLV